jgi:hypothetical protein
VPQHLPGNAFKVLARDFQMAVTEGVTPAGTVGDEGQFLQQRPYGGGFTFQETDVAPVRHETRKHFEGIDLVAGDFTDGGEFLAGQAFLACIEK